MSTNRQTFYALDQQVKTISRVYHEYYLRLFVANTAKERGHHYQMNSPENALVGLRTAYSYIRTIDEIVASLSTDAQLIIKNDYLSVSEPQWWLAYYKPNEYFLVKKKSLIDFLERQNNV